MSESPQREEELFAAALALPVAERADYLEQACGSDAALRRRVEALLRVHEEARDFLETPAVADLPAAALAGGSKLRPEEAAGSMIGRYRLLQKIGEGGCGTVYMAEQEEPVRRRVALKVIRLGMDTREVIARFEAERQALALMDHPNIAKVLDAGATDTGRPYFVMELVRGVKITDYCDQQNLPTAARLNLFIPVCHAIQHAHQKGVIHRDIKPSNILVTLQDGAPVPKVIDFGIAKATQGRLTDRTLFTAFEQLIGTPAYMSPEQAELSTQDVDTRSDIYSLGVLLYELLTGRTPFETNELLKAGLDEMRRQIREVEPPKPSTRLGTLTNADQTAVAQQRGTAPAQLSTLIRGDLDWIVMRCLEKNRTRRYATANELALDLERHQHDEPVTARRPSALYRFQKLVRRHKFAFVAAGLIAAALIAALGVSLMMYARERAARERAVAAEFAQMGLRHAAEREAAKSAQIARFLTDMLQGVGPSVAMGRDTKLLREILDKTSDRIRTELRDQPEVGAELSLVVGRVDRQLSEFEKSESMLKVSLALRQRLHGRESLQVADALLELAYLSAARERYADAEAAYRECLGIRRKLLGTDTLDVANVLAGLAGLLVEPSGYGFGDPKIGEALALDALAIRRKLRGDLHPDVAASLATLGAYSIQRGDYPKGIELLRGAVATYRKTLGDDHPSTVSAIEYLAWRLARHGDDTEAERLSREALERSRRIFGNAHQVTAASLMLLGYVLVREGKAPEGFSLMQEGIATAQRTLGPEHPRFIYSLIDLGQMLLRNGNRVEAMAIYREALELARKLPDDDLGRLLSSMGWTLRAEGEFIEAESRFSEEVAIARKRPDGGTATLANALSGLGWTFFSEGRYTEATPVFRESLAIRRRLTSGADIDLAEALQALAVALLKNDNYDEPEPLLRDAVTMARGIPSAGSLLANSLVNLSIISVHRGDYPKSEILLLEALDAIKDRPGLASTPGVYAIEHLADTYAAWAKTDPAKADAAATWREKLAAARAKMISERRSPLEDTTTR